MRDSRKKTQVKLKSIMDNGPIICFGKTFGYISKMESRRDPLLPIPRFSIECSELFQVNKRKTPHAFLGVQKDVTFESLAQT